MKVISEVYDQYLLCCLHFSICSQCIYWAPCRELQIRAMRFGLITHSGAMTKISEVSAQYLLCCLHFSICSLCIYWAPCGELQEWAPFLANGIWAHYTFKSYDKKFQKSRINICFVVSILIYSPYVYIELPVGSSRRELQIMAMGFGSLTHSGALTKKFGSLRSIFALLFAF